ncbi:MAG TPA: host attachment protein [Tepidisphaeraceae bacterium]|jgi:protein required for attachment to host cells|nr:host attachment protein [Tepidisphaeraceae bacterium]
MKRWILVSDSSGARIFQQSEPKAKLSLVHEIANPDGRAREQQLLSDEAGRVRKSTGKTNLSAMDPQTTGHEAVVERFAKQLGTLLDQAAQKDEYHQLVIAAPAHFLGLLRDELTASTSKRLSASTPKDLVRLTADEIPSHLSDELGPY